MPQHDYDIAGGNGAAVRADINAALAAIASTNKGPSPPPAPVAGMLWWDDNEPSTTVWTLKAYDGADWINLGELDTTTNRWTVSGSNVGKAILWATDAAAARLAIGATPTGEALIVATNAAAGRAAIGAAALSQGGAGVGQFLHLSFPGNTPVVAPAGGTWKYFFIQRAWATNTIVGSNLGIVAGGTTIVAADPALDHMGFWERIS